MGLLDDAIREHLDLKRRRGADPTEIERAEREALGPVRRGPDAEMPGDFDEIRESAPVDVHASVAAPLEEERFDDEADFEERFDDDPDFEDLGPHTESYAPDHEPEDAQAPPERSAYEERDEAARVRPVAADRSDVVERPRHPADQPAGDETVEWDVERALNEPSREEHDDVLEGTPEFLQDTPEHDRLWFEQRPPRDFDFNG